MQAEDDRFTMTRSSENRIYIFSLKPTATRLNFGNTLSWEDLSKELPPLLKGRTYRLVFLVPSNLEWPYQSFVTSLKDHKDVSVEFKTINSNRGLVFDLSGSYLRSFDPQAKHNTSGDSSVEDVDKALP